MESFSCGYNNSTDHSATGKLTLEETFRHSQEEMGIMMKRKQNGYSRLEKEDPEEKRHRQALFLIYKIMEQASNGNGNGNGNRRRPSCLRIRARKLKLRIGRRLKKLKKGMSMCLSTARIGLCNQFQQLTTCTSALRRQPKVEPLAFPSLVT
ncbi:hypothetical protein SDJN03_27079, partial [Cucurbita argyrosperma subsp. sororia]